jgi:hypothetical protein
MKLHTIRDLKSLTEYSRKITTPIFAVGAKPYNLTLGVSHFFPNFKILACKVATKEVPLIEKKIEIICLNENRDDFRKLDNYKKYRSMTPRDLFKSEKIISYLDSQKTKPVLLFFKMSQKLENLLKKRNYISVCSDFRMFNKYENKINFQKLLNKLNIQSIPNTVTRAKDINYDELRKKIGPQFVIQLPSSALGSGTFFVLKKADFDQLFKKTAMKEAWTKNINLKITRYIHRSFAPSMTVCVTKFGVLHTGLQKQIIDAKEVIERGRRSGVYCGHDWTASKFSKEIENQASAIAVKIGNYFKDEEKFNGIFGIDFVLEKDTNCLYPIEANVRLLGSFPILPMVQEAASQPPIQVFQILENLDLNDYTLDIAALNAIMAKPKKGAHINLYPRTKNSVYVSGNINPGVYKVDEKNKKVSFLREGVFFEDLKKDDEILLTNGVPHTGRVYLQHNNICKLISRHSFLNDDDRLNDFVKIMIDYVYQKLSLKQVK